MKLKNTEIKVLDKGFVRLVDFMGSDKSIVEAARVSYGKDTKKSRDDAGLISYLVENKHTTPLEMVEFKFHIKMPMFIARQMMRHRTANVNEYSARYSVMEKDFYIPEANRIMGQDNVNKQGSAGELSEIDKAEFLQHLYANCNSAYESYERALKIGVSRELARMMLPANIYTQFYWKIDLHNLLHFLKLRNHSHAQWEIQEYARAIEDYVSKICPIAYQAYQKFNKDSLTLTHKELIGLKNNVDLNLVTNKRRANMIQTFFDERRF